MGYKVRVEEERDGKNYKGEDERSFVTIYEQRIDELDVEAVILAVNDIRPVAMKNE